MNLSVVMPPASTPQALPPRSAAVAPPGAITVPSPPSDREKYCYFGRQHRWFMTVRTVAALSTAASLMLFSAADSVLWLFWISLTIFGAQLVLNHYTTTRPRRMDERGHRTLVEEWAPTRWPSVDVFLPSCGEDLQVLDNTYAAVEAMDYPGSVRVHVLDDSARPAVMLLARARGFDYAVRENRPHLKKAGNLKFGYDRSGGDFIVIFDADFAPRSDFLTELLPYFDDEAVGIVQSPQFFDSARTMSWLERAAGQVQESFYRWAQPSRDALGAPICVGTCAVYRRAALQVSGGFAQIGHSEDVHTGVNMMKVGFRTQYVPIVVAKGLCPDQLSSFISQQYRWCAGSMSLMVDPEFHAAPLTFRQRLCFYTGFGYYISTAAGVFLLAMPTTIMLWFFPGRVQVSNFFWVFPSMLLYPAMRVMHRSGWTPAVLRAAMIASFSHAVAILHVLRGRPAEWVPTGSARKTGMTSSVLRLLVVWEIGSNLALASGIGHFLVAGYGIVNVAPILVLTLINSTVWIPVLWLIARQSLSRPAWLGGAPAKPSKAEHPAPAVIPAQRPAAVPSGAPLTLPVG